MCSLFELSLTCSLRGGYRKKPYDWNVDFPEALFHIHFFSKI